MKLDFLVLFAGLALFGGTPIVSQEVPARKIDVVSSSSIIRQASQPIIKVTEIVENLPVPLDNVPDEVSKSEDESVTRLLEPNGQVLSAINDEPEPLEKLSDLKELPEPSHFQIVDLGEDGNIDLVQILGDFFEVKQAEDEVKDDIQENVDSDVDYVVDYEGEDEVEDEGEDEVEDEDVVENSKGALTRTGRSKTEKSDESWSSEDPAIVSQYNNFIDAFLRQLTSSIKATSDPLTIILRKNGKVVARPKGNKGGKIKKNVSNVDGDEGNETSSLGVNNRPNRPKGPRKNKNRRKNGNRHPKDLNLAYAVDNLSPEHAEGGVLVREKRQVAAGDGTEALAIEEGTENIVEESVVEVVQEDLEDREGRDFDDEYDETEEGDLLEVDSYLTEEDGKALSATYAGTEKGRSDSNEVESRNRANVRRRRKKGRRGRRRNGKCKKKCQMRRRRRRMRIRRRNKNKRNKNRGKRSIVGSTALLSGLSSIRRQGDVRVREKDQAQNILADVEIGPITLTAEKSFGEGSELKQRKSEAIAPSIKGKLVLIISKDGSAVVKTFRIFRPEDVSVSGSLRLDETKPPKRDMESYFTKISPFVSKRMKIAANQVFDFGQNKTRNKTNRNRPRNRNRKNKNRRNKPKDIRTEEIKPKK